MTQRSGVKWFNIGFLVTLLIMAAILFPQVGWTQEDNNLDREGEIGEAGAARTDDPAGRQFVAVADEETALSNPELLQQEASFTTSGHTDDPQGRTFIPLADEPVPADNVEGNLFVAAVDEQISEAEIIAASEAAQQMEAVRSMGYASPLVISAADFAPDGASPDSHFFPFSGGYFRGDSQAYGCVVAPAYLPDGANVIDLFASVYDNDTTFNISVVLRRVDNFNGGTDTMTNDATTSGDFAGVQVVNDFTIVEPLVAYPEYSYYVTTCLLSGDIRLYSVRLYYDMP